MGRVDLTWNFFLITFLGQHYGNPLLPSEDYPIPTEPTASYKLKTIFLSHLLPHFSKMTLPCGHKKQYKTGLNNKSILLKNYSPTAIILICAASSNELLWRRVPVSPPHSPVHLQREAAGWYKLVSKLSMENFLGAD